MRVHLISNLFSPDELAGAALYTDLAHYLRDAGHDVRVTTTFSYYPAWRRRPEDLGVVCRDETWQGLQIRRISMFVPEAPTGKGRLLSDFSFLTSLLRHGRFSGWSPDVVLTSLPMLSQCLVQRFLYPFSRIPKLIVVQDFVVEAALELGILRIPGAAGLLRALQRWSLRSAETLSTISPMMLEKLCRQVGPDRRTVYIPNWIHRSLQLEIQKQAELSHVRDSQRLFYAGNLGVKQGLPDFLKEFSAARCADAGWTLTIFGGGAEKIRIENSATSMAGVVIGPVLNEPNYISNLLTTTACLVTQRPGIGANFLPSKLLPALAAGTPVLAVCERSSPLALEVSEGGFGEVVEPADSSALKDCLDRWKARPEILNQMSNNAKARAEMYHRDTILPRYEAELSRLVESRTR